MLNAVVKVIFVQDDGGAGGGLQLGFVAGVILRERLPAFEKMLWRACRGNVFLRVAEIEDPLEDPNAGDEVLKSVFVIFFQGIYPNNIKENKDMNFMFYPTPLKKYLIIVFTIVRFHLKIKQICTLYV